MMQDERDVITKAAAEFPPVFGLRAFPGQVFRISIDASYVNGPLCGQGRLTGEVILYTETREIGRSSWACFCKGTAEELRRQIIIFEPYRPSCNGSCEPMCKWCNLQADIAAQSRNEES